MPIVVVLIAFAALVYGAYWSFNAIAAHFGTGIAVGAAVIAASLFVALIAWWWRRMRDIAPNVHGEGDWTHRVGGPWGEARLAAGKRFCELTQDGARGAYIFHDLQGAQAAHGADGWHVALRVADPKRPLWELPMPGEREAKRWARIFTLAIAQKL